MRATSYLTVLGIILATPAIAQSHKPAAAAKPAAASSNAPKELGKFEDWTAATHQESGATVCYAFTRSFVEYFRGDYGTGHIHGGFFTPAQVVSVGILAAGLVLFGVLRSLRVQAQPK